MSLIEKTGDWYKDRFIPSDTKVHKNCLFCNRDLYFPLSKSHNRNTCGYECSKKFTALKNSLKARNCLECNHSFTPRNSQINAGQGKYCSNKCATKNATHLISNDVLKKSQASRREGFLLGRWMPLSGDQHYGWKGGVDAMKLRNRLSGKAAAVNRRYRKSHPDKVREFKLRRNGKIIGRLPRGTVKSIGEKQRWKCPVCRCSIKESYHVDHVNPLAGGGKHERLNIQLLCPSCNVRKSAKHPIQFMQERGYLL